jgi:hypothetical protein
MKRYRKAALHIQLPPDKLMVWFRTNVTAKKNEATIPRKIARNVIPPFAV